MAHQEKRIKMFIVFITAPLGKMSMLSSIPTDKIWDRAAVQRGDQQ